MQKQNKNQDDFLSLEILSEMELGKVSGGFDESQGLTSKCWGATNGCWSLNLNYLTIGAGTNCQEPKNSPTPPPGGGGCDGLPIELSGKRC